MALRLRAHHPIREIQRSTIQLLLVGVLISSRAHPAARTVALDPSGQVAFLAGTGQRGRRHQRQYEDGGEDRGYRSYQRPWQGMRAHAPYPLPLKISGGT